VRQLKPDIDDEVDVEEEDEGGVIGEKGGSGSCRRLEVEGTERITGMLDEVIAGTDSGLEGGAIGVFSEMEFVIDRVTETELGGDLNVDFKSIILVCGARLRGESNLSSKTELLEPLEVLGFVTLIDAVEEINGLVLLLALFATALASKSSSQAVVIVACSGARSLVDSTRASATRLKSSICFALRSL
jgi:hypothetical protein